MTFEIEADDRGRLSLGKAGARPGRRYCVDVAPDGSIMLTPMVSIPERELDLLRDPDTQQRLLTGLGQAAQGETHDLGDFQQYT